MGELLAAVQQGGQEFAKSIEHAWGFECSAISKGLNDLHFV